MRLSAGRTRLSKEAQALCFFAGANSIFYGDRLLTAANPAVAADRALLAELNLSAQVPDPMLAPPDKDGERELSPACVGAGCCGD